MSLWSRIKERVARLFQREAEPGRWVEDHKFAFRGFLSGAPLVWPRRDYLVYVPRGWSRWRRSTMVVMCHGCKQTPEDFARAMRLTDVADRESWLLLLPRQKEEANPWRCWNWFDPATSKGRGEAAIVSAMIKEARRTYRAHPKRVFVGGISAGGALAACIGLHHSRRVRGVIVHSGLACGAATSMMSALNVMKRGPEVDVAEIGRAARKEHVNRRVVPLLVVHGSRDDVVAPEHAAALVRQFLALDGREPPEGSVEALPPPDVDRVDAAGPLRNMRVREWRDGKTLLARWVEVQGMGHAWSGGDAAFPYNDAAAPDATALAAVFVREASL